MEKSGIQACAFVDLDPVCRETIRLNRPRSIIFKDVFGADVIKFARNSQIDVIVGGPPCQSFSSIGKRGFLNDKRGQALLGFVKVVEAVQPEYFVLENVQGIVSAQQGNIVKQLRRRFAKSKYSVSWSIWNALDFNAPQSRKRFVMIGSKLKTLTIPSSVSVPKTLFQAIGDLEHNPGELVSFSRAMNKIMHKIPEGGCWRDLPSKIQNKAMGAADRTSGGLTAFYRRLDYGKPSPTLLTSPTHRGTTLCHPKQTRPLSVSEYKRIQCFPDNWKIAGSVRDKYRQIGNAVPVLLGKAIGKVLV